MENTKWDIKTVISLALVFASVVGSYAVLSFRVNALEAQVAKHDASLQVLNSEAAKSGKDVALALQALESKLEFTKSGVEKLVQSSMVQAGAPAAAGKR